MTLHLVIISHVSCCEYDFRDESLGLLLLMCPTEPFDSIVRYYYTIIRNAIHVEKSNVVF